MKRFDCNRVKPSTYLVRDEKVRISNLREAKREMRKADELEKGVKKVREYRETIAVNLPRRRKFGSNGCRLNLATRLLLERRRELNTSFRAELSTFVRG